MTCDRFSPGTLVSSTNKTEILLKVALNTILEAQWAEPVSLIFHCALRKLTIEPSIGASHQVSVHLAKQFQRRFFRNQPIRNKNCLWRPCLSTDRDEMSNTYRGLSIDASYQVAVHLARAVSQEKIFKKSANQKQDLPVAAMFVNGSGQNV